MTRPRRRVRTPSPRPMPRVSPYAPPRIYRCDSCPARVELDPAAALPAGWLVLEIPFSAGKAARAAYRCAACARGEGALTQVERRALIRELLADDIAAGLLRGRALVKLYRYCRDADLDRAGVCVVIGRLQAARGREAWDTVLGSVGKVEGRA